MIWFTVAKHSIVGSIIDYKIVFHCRLEELLADCLPQIERELCDPQVAACIKQVLSNIETSTHATNFLQLLCGGERDELEVSAAYF